MDKSSLKITELPALSVASENGFIPIAQVKEENDTYKVTLKKLRESVMFENAYVTTAEGVSNTVSGDVFFVYVDETKEHVLGWVNAGSGATPLLNGNGEQISYGTYALLNKALKDKGAVVQWIYNGGLSQGGEQTFTVPLDAKLSVVEVYVDGLRQFKNLGFELVENNDLSFTLAGPVKENQTVVALCYGTDDIEAINESFLATYTGPSGASNIGVSGGGTVQGELNKIKEKLASQYYFYPEDYRTSPQMSDDDLIDALFNDLQSRDVITNTTVSGTPRVIDFKGGIYTLTRTHQLDGFVGMKDGTIYCTTGRIILGRRLNADSSAGKTRRHVISNMHFEYKGTGNFPYALLELCRAFNTAIENCNFYGGSANLTNRSRYGLWCGSVRAWGVKISGGHYFGGQCPLRLGYQGDHTGCSIGGALTIDHGSVANLILCNPAGTVISGCNIEHAEDGAIGMAITSDTNGVDNVARDTVIEGVYFYNNGSGSTGTTPSPSNILIGYDIPGTMGWDVEGQLITSAGSARHIRLSECELVSPKCVRQVKVKAVFGVSIENNSYVVKTGETYAFTFEGTSASTFCQRNRNQSGGAQDEFEWAGSNPVLRNYTGTWTPSLAGLTTAGNNGYSNRSGYFNVINGVCTAMGSLELTSVDPAMAGDLFINLPLPCRTGYRVGVGINTAALISTVQYTVTFPDNTTQVITDSTTSATGVVYSNSTRFNLYLSNLKMQPANVKVTTSINFNIQYPVTAGTYTGS